MAKRLWDVYDGEPWMENPQLGILSLNKPRKGKKMAARKRAHRRKRRMPAGLARYWATHRRGGRKSTPKRRRRRARKNWISAGAIVPMNPRRRHRRNSPKRHRRHRRNPGGRHILGLPVPSIKTVAFGAVGLAGPSFVNGFLTSTFPSVTQQISSLGMPGKYIMKGVSIFGLYWLTKRFVGSSEANAVIFGGALNVGLSLVNDLAPGILPANPLSMYVATRPGVRAYVPIRPGMRGANVPGTGLPGRVALPAGVRTAASAPLAVQTRNIPRAQASDNAYNVPSRHLRF